MQQKANIYRGFRLTFVLIISFIQIPVVLQAATFSDVKNIIHINIEVTTHLGNDQTFIEGDHLSFLLNLDHDAYLLAIYQDASGNLVQVLPNSESSTVPLKAGMFIPIPEQNASFRFKVKQPFGNETLWVFASNLQPPVLSGTTLSNGLKDLKVNLETIRNKMRKRHQLAYGETHITIKTSATKNID